MPRLTSAELDQRLDLVVDPDADLVDVDEALARFLLAFVRKQSRSSPAAPAERGSSFNSTPPGQKESVS